MDKKIYCILVMGLLIASFMFPIANSNKGQDEHNNINKDIESNFLSISSLPTTTPDFIFSSKGGTTHLCQGGYAKEADSQNGYPHVWENSDASQLKNPPCNADWIWSTADADPSESPVSFCEYINVTCTIKKAEMYYSADDWITVWINNKKIIDEGNNAANDYYQNDLHMMDITSYIQGNGIPNELEVKVEDKFGTVAGGIWCIKVWCEEECYTRTVGLCDNFTLPYEPTNPSPALQDWLDVNYAYNPESRECDESGTNQYWAHTFDLSGLCPDCRIESATLEITVCNEDYINQNDALNVGCISGSSDSWEQGKSLSDVYGISEGECGIIILDLGTVPGLLDCMEEQCALDVAVQDDSMVDCALLTICCEEEYQPCVNIEKKIWGGDVWVDELDACVCENITINLSISNCGNCNLKHFYIEEILPDHLEYVPGSAMISYYPFFDPVISGNVLVWEFDLSNALPPWYYIPIEFDVHVKDIGEDRNCVFVRAHCEKDNDIYDTDQDCARINGINCACVKIDKYTTTGQGPIQVNCGDWINFTIDVYNCGNGEYDSLVIKDVLPPFVDYISGSASPTAGFSYDQSQNMLTWTVPSSGLPNPNLHKYFYYTVKVISCNCWNCTPENIAHAEATAGGILGDDTDSVLITVDDNTLPTVQITQPTPLFDDFALVFGSTTIQVTATDECRIKDVKLTIDGSTINFATLPYNSNNNYEWTWNEFMLLPTCCSLKVTAQDTCFNSNNDTMMILKWL